MKLLGSGITAEMEPEKHLLLSVSTAEALVSSTSLGTFGRQTTHAARARAASAAVINDGVHS